MMRDGKCYRQPKLERRIREIESGLWQTPRSNEARGSSYQYDQGNHNKPRLTLTGEVKMWPTPRKSDYKGTGPMGSKSHKHMSDRDYLCAKVIVDADSGPGPVAENTKTSGSLDPAFVEYLMGFPPGFSDLKPLGMHKFRLWLRQHGKS